MGQNSFRMRRLYKYEVCLQQSAVNPSRPEKVPSGRQPHALRRCTHWGHPSHTQNPRHCRRRCLGVSRSSRCWLCRRAIESHARGYWTPTGRLMMETAKPRGKRPARDLGEARPRSDLSLYSCSFQLPQNSSQVYMFLSWAEL